MKTPEKGDVLYKAWYLVQDDGEKKVIVEHATVRTMTSDVVFWSNENEDSTITHLSEIEEKWAYTRKGAVEKLRSRMQEEIDFLTAALPLVEEALEKA